MGMYEISTDFDGLQETAPTYFQRRADVISYLQKWATYFIADGDEYNVNSIVVYDHMSIDDPGTEVKYTTRKETCEKVCGLIGKDTRLVVIHRMDGLIRSARVTTR